MYRYQINLSYLYYAAFNTLFGSTKLHYFGTGILRLSITYLPLVEEMHFLFFAQVCLVDAVQIEQVDFCTL